MRPPRSQPNREIEIAAAQAMEKTGQIPKGVSSAVRKKAKVICLPELFLSNYFCQQEKHSNFNLAETIGELSKNAAANLGKLTTDTSLVESLTTNLSSEIAAAVNEVSEANPDLAVDSAAIQENTAAGLDAGAAAIPATCTFHGEVLSGYGDQGVEAAQHLRDHLWLSRPHGES